MRTLYDEGVNTRIVDLWLLQKKICGRSHWLGVKGGLFRWLLDRDEALALARREDADQLAEIIDDAESIVGWIAP